MTELPKSLKELTEETDKVLTTPSSPGSDSSGKLIEDVLTKSGSDASSLSRASSESRTETAKGQEKDEQGVGDFALGTVKGFGKGLYNLAADTKKLFFNYDDSAIRRAALSGGGVTNTGIGFGQSILKSGSELGTAFKTIVTNPGETFSGLGNKLVSDWEKGSSEKKGEMVGEAMALAATFGVGVGSLQKGLRNLSRLGKAEELAAGARVLGSAGKLETTVAGLSKGGQVVKEATAAERMLGTTGKLAKETRLETTVTGLGKASEMTTGERALGTTGRLAEGTGLKTTVSGLGKAGEVTSGERVLGGAARVGQGTRLETGVSALGRGGKAAEVTSTGKVAEVTSGSKAAEVTGATRVGEAAGREASALKQVGKLDDAGQVSAYSRISEAEKVAVELEKTSRALIQPTKIGQTVAADTGLAASREAQVLTREAQSVEEAVKAVRTAESASKQQEAMGKLRAAVSEYNKAVDAGKWGAELKISEKALAEFEIAVARSGEFTAAGRIEGASRFLKAEKSVAELESRGQALTQKLDDAKAVSSTSKTGEAVAVEQKATEVEQAIKRVKTAETAAAREQAITDLRAKVQEFNKAVETSTATAGRAGELKIADKTLAEFEAAARQAGEARTLAFRNAAAGTLEAKSKNIAQSLDAGRKAAEGTQASAAVAKQAAEVEQSLARVRTAETAAARERAITELQQNTQAYNRLIESNPATAARAGELRLSEKTLAEFQAASREAHHARVLAKHEPLVTASATRLDAEARTLSQQLSNGRAAVTGMKAEEALAVRTQARHIEESIQAARASRTTPDHVQALHDLRRDIEAYNAAIARSGLPAHRVKELQISEQALTRFEAVSREANHARIIAQTEISISAEYIRRMAGRSDLVFVADGARGSLAGRIDGLAASQVGSIRAAMDKVAAAAANAWSRVTSEAGYVARGLTRADAATLFYTGAGAYLIGIDLYYVGSRTIERINRLAAEQKAQEARAAQDKRQLAGEGTRAAEVQRAAAVEQTRAHQKQEAGNSAQQQRTEAPAGAAPAPGAPSGADQKGRGADEPAPRREAADRSLGAALERSAYSEPKGQAGRTDLTLSPVLHAMRAPGYQATPALVSTAEMFVTRQKEEYLARKRRQNQFGQEWYGPHVYLYAPPQVEAESRPAPPPQPTRRVGSGEPDVSRIVSPIFKPQVIYAAQSELFGSSGRAGEARLVSAVGPEGSRRVRATLLHDEQRLVKQYPFLVTAAGETGISSGSKTVFKLAGVEKQEPKAERPGGTQSTAGAVVASGGPTPVLAAQAGAGQSNPTAGQDEEA